MMMMLVNDGYTKAMDEDLVKLPVKRAAEKGTCVCLDI